MGKPVVGEVVVLPFPQSNLQSGKRRPALVVADLVGDDLVLCQITRKPRADGYSIPLVLADFERGRLGLVAPKWGWGMESTVVCRHAATSPGKSGVARLASSRLA